MKEGTKNRDNEGMTNPERKGKQKPDNKLERIGTWNVRSIKGKEEEIVSIKGKEEEIVEEMLKQGIEILGITETKKKGKGIKRIHKGYWLLWSGIKRIHKGYWLLWSGVDEGRRAREGVGLIIAPNRLIDIISEEYVNERILTVKIKLLNDETWTLIVTYGENEDANKEKKEEYFMAIQQEIDEAEKIKSGQKEYLSYIQEIKKENEMMKKEIKELKLRIEQLEKGKKKNNIIMTGYETEEQKEPARKN
ncbi:hypothetical protein QE152_g40962 [Popillia japonica]|uniref:Uncharacterized protein n=1 Tax=Popillia japonica TaxID=7064 RepID=A0AAW1HF33_POPJA